MKSLFIEKEIPYTGLQLRSHWILESTGLKQDAILAFVGPCHVNTDHMVDLEDVLQKKNIYSESMLHFIVEHFDCDLEKAILRQRLLICQIQTELIDSGIEDQVIRRGDDLFVDSFKLTISIATSSPLSCLIHTGINISSQNTPVPTKGLHDYGLNPPAFAKGVMNRYIEELESIRWARCKVKGVQ